MTISFFPDVSEPGTIGPFSGTASQTRVRPSKDLLALLGILLWDMAFVPFEDKAIVLGMTPAQLESAMHGEEEIGEEQRSRWAALAEVLRNLQGVLRREGTGAWLRTKNPVLNGRTPIAEIADGNVESVVAATRRYLDTSFS